MNIRDFGKKLDKWYSGKTITPRILAFAGLSLYAMSSKTDLNNIDILTYTMPYFIPELTLALTNLSLIEGDTKKFRQIRKNLEMRIKKERLIPTNFKGIDDLEWDYFPTANGWEYRKI